MKIAFVLIVLLGVVLGVLGIVYRRKAKEVLPGAIAPVGKVIGDAVKKAEAVVEPVVKKIGDQFPKS